jgi:glycosyltransferase involved in cell wall biosynthesis
VSETGAATLPQLSVIVVARNEALNIADCVLSAAFAGEVLVLDSGSSDGTADLARAAGARVMVTDWPGYGPQQNRAIDACSGEWIFSLDADERISPELAQELARVLAQPSHQVYDVPRSSLYLTRFMRHSGWWPDRTRRLFRRGSARFTGHLIHANLQTEKLVGSLEHPIIHYSFRDLHGVVEKMNRYSSGTARDLDARGKRGSLGSAVAHGLWAFIRTYFVQLGFLDGPIGFVLAVSNAEGVYYKYLKLAELQGRLPR